MLTLSNKLLFISNIIRCAYEEKLKNMLLQATKNKCAVTFNYQNISDNKTKTYTVMPLQIKKRQLQIGFEFVLYAEDVDENNRTKSFVLKKISNITVNYKNKKRIRKNQLEKFIKDF